MSRLNDGEKKKVFHSSPRNHPYGNAAAVYRLCFALPQCVADIFIAYSATLEAATLPRLWCLKTRLRPVCWRPTPATHSIDGVNRRTRRATTRRSCKLYSAEVWATAEQVSVVPTCSAVQPPGWGRTMAWESHDVATGHNWRHGKRTSRRCVPRLGLCSCTYVRAVVLWFLLSLERFCGRRRLMYFTATQSNPGAFWGCSLRSCIGVELLLGVHSCT